MKLTDKEAIKALNKVRCEELWEMVDSYPEDERDGRTDWEMIANEAGWLLDSYNSYGETAHAEDLEEARELLKRTEYGKVMPLRKDTLTPIYKPYEVDGAKNLVNEYNRLTRFVTKLKSMGLYCPYC